MNRWHPRTSIKTVSFVVLQFFTTSTTTGVTASHFFLHRNVTRNDFFRGYLSKRFSTVSSEMDRTLTVFRANRKFRQSRSEKFRSAPRPWRWVGWTASGTATTPTATSTSTPFSPFPWRRSSSRLTSTTSVSSLHRFLSNNKKTFNARARNSVSAVSAVWRKKVSGRPKKTKKGWENEIELWLPRMFSSNVRCGAGMGRARARRPSTELTLS